MKIRSFFACSDHSEEEANLSRANFGFRLPPGLKFLCRPALCPSICRNGNGSASTPCGCSPKLSQKVLAYRRPELESVMTLQQRFRRLGAGRGGGRPIGAPALSRLEVISSCEGLDGVRFLNSG